MAQAAGVARAGTRRRGPTLRASLPLAGFAVLAVGYPHLAAGSVGRSLAYDGFGLAMAATCWLGAARRPAGGRLAWFCLAGGLTGEVGGDLAWNILGWTGSSLSSPGWPDGLYLLGYALVLAGVVQIARRAGARGSAVLLEGTALAAALVAAGYHFTVLPYLSPALGPPGARLISAAYPMLDTLGAAALVVAFTLRVASSTSLRLLLGSQLCWLVGDTGFGWSVLHGSYGSAALDLAWLGGYALLAAAALRPPNRTPPVADTVSISLERAIVLGLSALAAPGTLLVQGLFGLHDLVPLASLGTVATLAIGLRLAGIVAQLRRQTAALADALAGREEMAASLAHAASHDELTGLANRTLLQRRAVEMLAEPGPKAVCILDLDDFKAVNDTYGHGAGDELLVAAARRLSCLLRDADTVARLGGDEFALLVAGVDEPAARHVADRVLAALDEPFTVAGRRLTVRGSIGITLVSAADGPADCARALAEADIALYAAKKAGGARTVVYRPQMRDAVLGDPELAGELAAELAAGRLGVAYQPIIASADGGVFALEALARFTSPTRGPVPTGSFLTVAASRGLLPEVDLAVARQAIAQLARWRRLPGRGDLVVSVNVSAELLGREALPDLLLAELGAAELPGSALCVEVTEQALIADLDTAARSLQALRSRGVLTALDDFGAGYSSLAYLGRLPMDMLKLDRALLDREVHDGVASPLLTAAVGIGPALRLRRIAEGVETAEQEAVLTALGCEYLQGFRYARPMDAAATLDWLARSDLGAELPRPRAGALSPARGG